MITVRHRPTGERLLALLQAAELYGFIPAWPATPARPVPHAPNARGVTTPPVEQGLEADACT